MFPSEREFVCSEIRFRKKSNGCRRSVFARCWRMSTGLDANFSLSKKMAYVFTTYGDERYVNSLIRISDEAKELGIFDEVRIWTPEKLPPEVKNCSTFKKFRHGRGGGYWVWKPWIIRETLESLPCGSVLFYCDSGCEFMHSRMWKFVFFLMRFKDALFFEIGGKSRNWCRKSVFGHFAGKLPLCFAKMSIFWGGALFLKKNKRTMDFLESWSDAVLVPELIEDVPESERKYERPDFIEHRHDQAVLTACIYGTQAGKKLRKAILPDFSGKRVRHGQILFAARKSDTQTRSSNKIEHLPMTFLRCIGLAARWGKNRILSKF